MILVTGGTGLVGSHLVYYLLKKGKNVKVLKRTKSDINRVKHEFSYYTTDYEKLFNKINWIEGDVIDYSSVYNALKGINEIYHTAGIVSFNPKKKELLNLINFKGTRNIVNAALSKKVNKLCFVSSIATIGDAPENELINENNYLSISGAKSVYSFSKLAAEMEVWRGMTEGLNAVIINPSVILGPGDWNKSSSVIFSTIWNGLKFYTKGITGYVDVKDVCEIMIELMEKNVFNERFIVSSENISFHDLFIKIADNLNKKRPTIQASVFLTNLAWRFEKLRSLITNNEPLITKESVKSSHFVNKFSNAKIIDRLNYKFIPINKSINENCAYFLSDQK